MITFEIDSELRQYTEYLRDHGLIEKDDQVTQVSKAGEGNMNVVVRLQTEQQSLILKQSRPFVQKYPQLKAPIERIRVEARFYQVIERHAELARRMPRILFRDLANHILVIEDLGRVQDYTSLYAKDVLLEEHVLGDLFNFLALLHQIPRDEILDFPSNLELRKLNHEHVFSYPFMVENGFDLDDVTPGLQEASLIYKNSESLKSVVEEVGQIYLGDGAHLLHGDFYPGSWIEVEGMPMVLDPEFAFVGPAEFDLGVLQAHLRLGGVAMGPIDRSMKQYSVDLDHALVRKYCGIEILRRVIGLAQLPLDADLNDKIELLQEAHSLVLH